MSGIETESLPAQVEDEVHNVDTQSTTPEGLRIVGDEEGAIEGDSSSPRRRRSEKRRHRSDGNNDGHQINLKPPKEGERGKLKKIAPCEFPPVTSTVLEKVVRVVNGGDKLEQKINEYVKLINQEVVSEENNVLQAQYSAVEFHYCDTALENTFSAAVSYKDRLTGKEGVLCNNLEAVKGSEELHDEVKRS